MAYVGGVDKCGKSHGRGTLVLDEDATYEGHFVHGTRCGRGKLTVNEADGEWMVMQGTWADDELVHASDIVSSDGTVIRGPIKDGQVDEFDLQRLCFRGQYKDGLRDGAGTLFLEGGGETRGVWHEGELQEESQVYQYPCRFGETLPWDALEEDVSTAETISSHSLRVDPYEARRVCVRSAPLKGGEGLFAKIDLVPFEVVSFYNGVRLSHDAVDGRDWERNNNTISLSEDEVIDVPPPWDDTRHYCATLGHKANHCHVAPNAKYDVFHHPRFGDIKCIRALGQPIVAGQEVLVDYGFDGQHGYPSWWKPPS